MPTREAKAMSLNLLIVERGRIAHIPLNALIRLQERAMR